MLQGVAAFRWAAWGWLAVVLVLSRQRLDRPLVAAGVAGLALSVTIGATAMWRAHHSALLRPGAILAELVVGFSVTVLDGVVRHRQETIEAVPSIASVWPLAGVFSAGVAGGPWAGGAAGLAIGVARVVSTLFSDQAGYDRGRVLGLTTTVVLYCVAGAVSGYVWQLLRRAESEVAAARAREEVARTLHDGVLQTLALVERRATDPALARLAREQERDLREFLFGPKRPDGDGDRDGDLAAALRAAAGRFESTFGGRADVVVPPDLGAVPAAAVTAIAGAVGEALTNAGKHGCAARVVVYAEAEDGLFCSVKDDGKGCEPSSLVEGVGLRRSIRGRLEELGGRVQIVSRPGAGMEVRMWLP